MVDSGAGNETPSDASGAWPTRAASSSPAVSQPPPAYEPRYGVFISYNGRDQGRAREIAERLREGGSAVWFDSMDLPADSDWHSEVTNAIARSRYFLVLVSRAPRPQHVTRELEQAMALASQPIDTLNLIPVILDGTGLPRDLERWEPIDARSSAQVDRLVKTVESGEPLAPRRPNAAAESRIRSMSAGLPRGSAAQPDYGSEGLFISYRREDEPAFTGRIYDWLADAFGPEKVFQDIESMELGGDFVEAIKVAISASSVLVVVIGKQWLHMADEFGRRRIDDPDDYVRLEIETAINLNKKVVPITLEGAGFPPAEAMPQPIADNWKANGLALTNRDFRKGQADHMIKHLRRII